MGRRRPVRNGGGSTPQFAAVGPSHLDASRMARPSCYLSAGETADGRRAAALIVCWTLARSYYCTTWKSTVTGWLRMPLCSAAVMV